MPSAFAVRTINGTKYFLKNPSKEFFGLPGGINIPIPVKEDENTDAFTLKVHSVTQDENTALVD